MTRSATLLPLVLLLLIDFPASSASAGEDDDLVASLEAYLSAPDAVTRREHLAKLDAVPLPHIDQALDRVRFSRKRLSGRSTVPVRVEADDADASYELSVPPGYDPSRRYPLLIAKHGSGWTGEDETTLWRASTDAHGYVLACPTEQAAYAEKGWGSSDGERDLVLAVLDDVLRRTSVDPDRVFLTGESRGGHGSWEMGMLAPDRWAGIRPCAGGPRIFVRPLLENLVPIPVYDVQGAKDQPRLVHAVREACTALRRMGGNVTHVESPDHGHEDVPGERARFYDWAVNHRRDLFPKQVRFTLGKGDFRRNRWVQVDRLKAGVPDPRTVRASVQAPPGASQEQRRKLFVGQLGRKLGHIDAKVVEGNRILVKSTNVVRVTLFLSDRLVDLDRPITVVWNGRARRHKVTRSTAFLLEHIRETGDLGRRFVATIRVP